MSTAFGAQPASATAALSRLLQNIDDVGVPAVIELNRAHRGLTTIEDGDLGKPDAAPSWRWYRLYEQLAQRALYPDPAHSYPHSHMLTLSAGLLLQEAAGMERRAGALPRHKSRAHVRDQVESAVEFSRAAAAELLDKAIQALAGPRARPERPTMVRHDRALQRADTTSHNEVRGPGAARPYMVGAVSYAPARVTGPVRLPGDLGEGLRSARREVELNELAAAASSGDRHALERLLGLIRPTVVRYCRARIGDGVGLLTAEDVAQDVLFAVCGALGRYRPGETAAMAFVFGLARNKVVDAFRAAERDRSDTTDAVPDAIDDQLGPEAAAVIGMEAGELRDLLELLPAAQREILVLRVALQFSAEETAFTVGSTPGAVRVTQHRALSKLRALISERMPH